MGLGVLLRLLASFQILPRLVTPAAPLPAPTVITDPQHPVYFPGESLTLRCSAPRGEVVQSYRFYNQRGQRFFMVSPKSAQWPRLIMTTEMGEAGAYSCDYLVVREGEYVYSPHSRPVRVPVKDLPMAPSISATASGSWDDLVTIVCSLPTSYKSKTFQMFKNRHIVQLGVSPTPQGTRLQLHTSDPVIAGSYTCSYETDVAGRKVQSRPSSSISIHLPEPPGAPSLSLNPSHTVYLPGETITLTCSVPPGAHTARGFQFSRDGGRTVSSGISDMHALIVTGPGDSGSYTCAYWIHPSQWGVQSQESQPVSISVTARPPPPRLALDPPQPVYLHGEWLALRCVAPPAEGKRRYRFFKQSGGQHPEQLSAAGESDRLDLGPQMGTGGGYACGYWVLWSERWIPSGNSLPVAVSLTDPPPRPALSVDPPSEAVSEGLPLNITCVASGEAADRRFHFYKDGAEMVPGDVGSEMSTMEPGNGSRNVSVLSIPRASLNSSGEFTCRYEENVRGRWIPSPWSRALNLTVNVIDRVSYNTHVIWLLAMGGILLLAGALTVVTCRCRRKKRGEKLQENTKGSDGREGNRDLDPGHDNKGPKDTGAGAEQREEGSEVTYAHIAFSALEAHTALSKSKAQPAEDEHVLYSEVVTTRTQKADK